MVTGGHESVATVEVKTQRLAQRAAEAWPTLYRESSWGQIYTLAFILDLVILL